MVNHQKIHNLGWFLKKKSSDILTDRATCSLKPDEPARPYHEEREVTIMKKKKINFVHYPINEDRCVRKAWPVRVVITDWAWVHARPEGNNRLRGGALLFFFFSPLRGNGGSRWWWWWGGAGLAIQPEGVIVALFRGQSHPGKRRSRWDARDNGVGDAEPRIRASR